MNEKSSEDNDRVLEIVNGRVVALTWGQVNTKTGPHHNMTMLLIEYYPDNRLPAPLSNHSPGINHFHGMEGTAFLKSPVVKSGGSTGVKLI